MHKIENGGPIRAFVPKIAIPRSQHGGQGQWYGRTEKFFLRHLQHQQLILRIKLKTADRSEPSFQRQLSLGPDMGGQGQWYGRTEKFFLRHLWHQQLILRIKLKTADRSDPSFLRYVSLAPKRGIYFSGMVGLENFLTSFVPSRGQTMYKIENR